eukprot:CAMPEP_0182467920 /NCGR_PEP_ID=MMETSP1319-20130603/14710_1 /TAXON_ID=172717 /ORGANISM="Bolidomonas pacifica, Strain RCC208" /LENGTH=543 /DNA_ID=CAMNT_0024668065 /DNA_START=212 /DNA_END=1843 /DNA_ORIENTATION=+
MLKVAGDLGAIPHRRKEGFESEESPDSASRLFHHLATDACPGADYVMYTTCVTPFMSRECIEEMVSIFRFQPEKYDSVVSVGKSMNFFWFEGRPLNFDPAKQCKSQDLSPLLNVTYGACIIARTQMIETRNCVGSKPMLYEVDELQAIDIDSALDFVISEQLFESGISGVEEVADRVLTYSSNQKPLQTPLLLDCTIRDGGYRSNWDFSDSFVTKAYAAVTRSGMDYFEIGFRHDADLYPQAKGFGKWACVTDEMIRHVRAAVKDGCKISLMCKMGCFKTSNFSRALMGEGADMVRVLFPPTDGPSHFDSANFSDCLTACQDLRAKGYTVCVNVAGADLYTMSDLENLCSMVVTEKPKGATTFGSSCIDYLYLADTFGSVEPYRAKLIVKKVRFELEVRQKCSFIGVGFHAHDSMGDGWCKTEAALRAGAQIIDSCIHGLGRGGGNVKSEIVLCQNWSNKHLDFGPILEFGDENIQSFRDKDSKALFMVASHLQIHPDYAQALLEEETFGTMSINECIATLRRVKVLSEAGSSVKFDASLLLS